MTKFVAYDGAEYRVDRLIKAAQITADLIHLSPTAFNVLVAQMTDNKGVLRVDWEHYPTRFQKDMFGLAWELCKERRDAVEHFMDLGTGARKV